MRLNLEDGFSLDIFITQYYDPEYTLVSSNGPNTDDWQLRYWNKTRTKWSDRMGTDVKLMMNDPYFEEGDIVPTEFLGTARVDSRDTYSKEVGRKLAGRKALDELQAFYELSDYEKKLIWSKLLPKHVKVINV